MSSGDRGWENGWDGHERAQRRRLAALPLTEKLRWLDEADALVRHLRSRRERTGVVSKSVNQLSGDTES